MKREMRNISLTILKLKKNYLWFKNTIKQVENTKINLTNWFLFKK